MIRHLIIPDTQVKPGDPIDHLRMAGEYAVDKKPDVIVHIGDHFDMPSLSSYDVGKKSYEGRRYLADIEAGQTAMQTFLTPIWKEQKRLRNNKKKLWNPRLIFTLGNHENRINRAIEGDAKLDGLMSTEDLRLKEMGWEVHDFLQPVIADGIVYSHYFVSGVMGRPVTSARILLTKKHMSCVMGHVQDKDIAYARKADGSNITGLFAGIFYPGDEQYLNPQTNGSWKGIWLLNDVQNGSFDELPISLKYLERKYG